MKYFENHFLFSETYIKEYIKQENKKKNEADDDMESAFQQVKDWNNEYVSGDFSKEHWFGYIDSVLDVLKFPGKNIVDNTRVLYANTYSENETPAVVCYFIDKHEDIASAKKGKYHAYDALSAAKAHGVNWAMLTNGYQWRIYNVKNVSPYENYLEVDIEESIKNNYRADDAFKLFYLFFNAHTYYTVNEELEIERIKDLSDTRAETIEESLRGKAEEILKELCYGLKEDINKECYEEVEKKAIYNDAIILLYRLLFFGYAESRGLLPIKENDPEYTDRYKKLCNDAKELHNSGEVYKVKDGFEFWGRLDNQLRLYVDRSYNGGLFHNDDKLILKEHRISNGRLTKCLAELSYNADKTGRYSEPIEYKDLSVRNLGSIYEGLLEYQLFIADERMVQRKSKGQVKYLRAADITLQNSDYKSIIEKGSIYLSQDALERKETGAYYTPEDVVEYIVDNTVGKKLKELKEELRDQTKELFKQISYEPLESRKRAFQNQIDEITMNFVNEKILSLSIIDSAMGSGHFLVNAAYRVANEIVGLICENAWESTIDDLNKDVRFWVRKVVENCIYGIDINGLSVALARLSLWLISASNDKALSFIDHHLKEGNSIIGTDRKHVEVKDSKTPMFGVTYEEYMQTILMKYEELKKVGSATKANVLRQKEIYDEINNDLRVTKKKYNYYLASQYAGGIKNRITYVNLLRSNDIRDFEDEDMESLWDIAREKKFFHWEIEFPEVFQKGGFDIAIGNPPYVDVIEYDYKYSIFKTLNTRNLYSYMMENNIRNNSCFGFFGFIIPLSGMYTPRMKELQEYLLNGKELYVSNYSIRPGKIFKNVEQRVSIIIGRSLNRVMKSNVYTTKYIRWYSNERKSLFRNIKYEQLALLADLNIPFVPKIGNEVEMSILNKIFRKQSKLKDLMDSRSDNKIYYHSSARYWLKAFNFIPSFYSDRKGYSQSSEYKSIYFKENVNSSIIACLINSSLFYWYWILLSDERHFLKKDIENFPLNYNEIATDLIDVFEDVLIELMDSYKKFSVEKVVNLGGNVGTVKYQEFHPKYSKEIINKIDDLLGSIYGFTIKEVDFIKTFDLRFRMGEESTEEDE